MSRCLPLCDNLTEKVVDNFNESYGLQTPVAVGRASSTSCALSRKDQFWVCRRSLSTCTADLVNIAEKHSASLHAFADDTRTYLHSHRMPATAVQLERRISVIGHWMSVNGLQLNMDKTELL